MTQGLSVDGVVGLEETVGVLREQCVCVCLCLYEGVDQSEVVLETVTAPNLLYQLPSVLTDTVSFSKKELSSTPLSPLSACFLSVSLPVDCLFVFATHTSISFFYTHLFMPYNGGWIPLPNPFVPSFLPLCHLYKPYHSVCHCFQIQPSREPQN